MPEGQIPKTPPNQSGIDSSPSAESEARRDRVVAALTEHFAPHGITAAEWHRAAVARPDAFAWRQPDSLISNIEAIIRHFANEGLTARQFLGVIVKFPQLLDQKPSTLIANIEGVVRHFARVGLSTSDYLSAALKQPSLFARKPETVIVNIESVVRHFANDGLTARDYLRAALKQPTLFYQKPSTLIANVEAVVSRFTSAGLTTRHYLRAALKQPPLFALKPRTIIGHINILAAMHEGNLLPIEPGRQALMDFIVDHAMLLTLADDNLHLREIAAHLTGEPTAPIPRTRRQYVEDSIGEALRRNDGNAESSHARRLLLNALKREGYLKGK